ncbi:hypothetical protein Tco_1253431 [Tanacetum coccineum]
MLAPKGPTFNGRRTFANPMYLIKAQSEKPCLYEIPYDQSDPANRLVPDREETLTLEKESRSKLNKDLVRPYDYTKLNKKHSHDHFRAPTAHDMEILIKTCLMPLAIKTQNDSFTFVHELKQEMHADLKYVESLENEIDELESDKAEFSNMYDILLQECVSNDVMCSYLHSLSDLDAHTELQCLYLHKVKECECLAQKLSKQTETVSKEVYTELSRSFAKLEKHSISLELALQQCQEQMKNDTGLFWSLLEFVKAINGNGKTTKETPTTITITTTITTTTTATDTTTITNNKTGGMKLPGPMLQPQPRVEVMLEIYQSATVATLTTMDNALPKIMDLFWLWGEGNTKNSMKSEIGGHGTVRILFRMAMILEVQEEKGREKDLRSLACIKADERKLDYIRVVENFPESEEGHEVHLKTILDLLEKEKLYAKFSKCEFWLKEVQFLGHVVKCDSIHVDPSKVESVKNWKTPESSTKIRSFLGDWHGLIPGELLRNVSKIAKPLHVDFKWIGLCVGR